MVTIFMKYETVFVIINNSILYLCKDELYSVSVFDTLFCCPGAIMVPGGGIGVAQPGVIASNAVSSASMVAHPGLVGGKAVSSASDHQSLGKTVFHVSNGQGAWHAGLPLVPQMNILPQMLTPQINTQIITSATTQQFQKQGIAAEKSAGMRDQDTQTEAAGTCQQALAPPRTALQPSGKSYPVEYLKETLAQEGARFKLPADQSRQSHDEKTNTSLVMTKGAGLNTAEEGRHPHSSTVSSDYEVFLVYRSDLTHQHW